MKPTDDKKLVEGCLCNDKNAQKALYDQFSPLLMGVCMRYANSQEEGEDILIEGFTKIFSHLGDFRFDCSLLSWMKRIMLNTAISSFRKNHKHHNQLDVVEDDDTTLCSSRELPSDKVMQKDLLKLIQQMPETYRIVFNLAVVEGYSHKEIGELLGIQESSSRSQLTRARNWLKLRWEK